MTDQSRSIYPLFSGGHVAIATGPAGLYLGADHTLTDEEVAQLQVLLWLEPTQAVLLAQQLFDAATPALSIGEIEKIRTMLAPEPAAT